MDVKSYKLSKKYTNERVQELTGLDYADLNAEFNNKANQTEVDALTTQMASTAKQIDLVATNNTVAIKADQTYVDTKFMNIGNASPKGSYATLSALQTAFPTGTSGVYVVVADGKWYYWNSNAWTAGGAYQSTGISPESISVYNTNFITPYNIILFDTTKVTSGGNYSSATPFAWTTYAGMSQSDFISCVPGDVFKFNGTKTGGYNVVFKNSIGTIFAGQFKTPSNGVVSVTVPADAVSMSTQIYDSEMNTLMIVKNMEIPNRYLSFSTKGTLIPDIKLTSDNLDDKSISASKMMFKTVGDYITDDGVFINLFDKTKTKSGGHYSSTSPYQWTTYAGLSESEFISCSPGDVFKFNGTKTGGYHIVFKNSSGVIFSGQFKTPSNGIVSVTVPTDAVSVASQVYDSESSTLMFVKNINVPVSYVPFINAVTFGMAFENAIVKIVDSKLYDTEGTNLDSYLANRFLVWEDDFEGTTLDNTSWTPLVRSDGNGHGELGFNTDRTKNIKVENNKLVITAIKENYMGKTWTSGQINTSNLREFQYGRIEAKMKLPKGQGFWPAFWTLGASLNVFAVEDGKVQNTGQDWPNCGEIDIFEYYNNNTYITSTAHYYDGVGHASAGEINSGAIDVTQYHVYGIEWTDIKIDFLVDGVVYGTFNVANADASGDNPFRKPHYIILNLAVNGISQPDGTTPNKASMFVDWVRVYAPVGETSYVNADSVSLDKSTINMTLGNKIPLVTTILPANTSDKTIKWSSSDTNVAVVGSGYVTALRVGICTITAKTINNKKVTCAVTVN